MEALEDVLREMDFDFFGQGLHKTTMARLLDSPDAVLLDVRSVEETHVAAFPLRGLAVYLHIPTSAVPDRLAEIPKDVPVGLFCSASVRACMVYVYLRARGYKNVRVVEGGYAGLLDELKPGKVRARLTRRPAN